MIDRARFQVALERIDPAQWRLFEQLGLVFLSEEYPSLRPVAATSGDGGQDAILFRSDDAPEVTLQFTVRADWARKIEQTCTRLKETAPETQVLIYGTSRLIGPEGNKTRKSVRERYGVFLDIRDREWFLRGPCVVSLPAVLLVLRPSERMFR